MRYKEELVHMCEQKLGSGLHVTRVRRQPASTDELLVGETSTTGARTAAV